MTNEEINEAVARKLGWTFDDSQGFRVWVTPEGERVPALPLFSKSIEAAWEIINTFHEVTVGTVLRESAPWFCELRPQGKEPVKEFADTVMLAICRAFLKLG